MIHEFISLGLYILWLKTIFSLSTFPQLIKLHDLQKKKLDSEETQWDSTFSMVLGPKDSVKFYSNGNNEYPNSQSKDLKYNDSLL